MDPFGAFLDARSAANLSVHFLQTFTSAIVRGLGRFSVPATVAWDTDGNRVVLADLRTGTRTALSDTATLIWQLAGEGLTSQEILAELTAAFPDAPNSLPAEVAAALEELVGRGWLRGG